ncbi:MAG: glycoside hydrolase family 3 C-terminal domain-containing protein [Protaetiibacter sp.]
MTDATVRQDTDSDLDGLTTQQKAALGSGADFWTTKAVGDIPSIMMTDGPHGLRKQVEASDHLGVSASVPATCFPPAVALAQTWDPELAESVGAALGRECQANEVQVLLGPGVNLKRSPLGGRNFEYFSEDPLLAGALGAGWVRGLQGQGVGASLKHFALNNQEDDRMRSSSDVDPRPLRELYLRSFERVVRDAQPWTVMCSYNKVNGVQVSNDPFLLTRVLREEWGFEGVVVSDWGAVVDRVKSVAAGLDLQMPGGDPGPDDAVVAAVADGSLAAPALDAVAGRMARLARRAHAAREEGASFDAELHHALARQVAGRAIVLLKNEGALLPLAASGSIAVVGEFARTPRYQGGGSSHVNPTRLDVPLDELRAAAPEASIEFAPGFTVDGSGAQPELEAEAVRIAGAADVAVLFLGLDAAQESEGFDREHIELPEEQLAVLERVVAVQPRTVVVLSHGGVLRLAPVAELAPAILDGALLGQAGGGAIADVLFGAVNPSGRLAETVPVRLQDTPAYLNFPGESSHVRYGEGLFIGYRWYDARELEVTFPFGHGLSYTSFRYDGLELAADGDGIRARVTVTNAGDRSGREIVQAYVSLPGSSVQRPVRWLGGFAAVELGAGESRTVELRIEGRDLAYWDVALDRFVVEPGGYRVSVGSSSRELHLSDEVELAGEEVRTPLTMESTLGEVLAHPIAGAVVAEQFAALPMAQGDSSALGMDMMRMMMSVPIERIVGFAQGQLSREQIAQLIEAANAG